MKLHIHRNILLLLAAVLAVYILFFMHLPFWGIPREQVITLTEAQVRQECPAVLLTEEDRALLDAIYADPRIQALQGSEDYQSLAITADEAGFPRYAARPEENYTVSASTILHGNQPLLVSLAFAYAGDLYQQRPYLSIDQSMGDTTYAKVISIQRFDGRKEVAYWNANGSYERRIYCYGLVNYLLSEMEGLLSA